jgi:hypothetical protein
MVVRERIPGVAIGAVILPDRTLPHARSDRYGPHSYQGFRVEQVVLRTAGRQRQPAVLGGLRHCGHRRADLRGHRTNADRTWSRGLMCTAWPSLRDSLYQSPEHAVNGLSSCARVALCPRHAPAREQCQRIFNLVGPQVDNPTMSTFPGYALRRGSAVPNEIRCRQHARLMQADPSLERGLSMTRMSANILPTTIPAGGC